ncbi:MAG: hypothetical protein L3K17_02750 [Thermoplasmata archaeon]|nr:hypothetical protein [Thermoplasmata archaeon]
MVNETPPTLLSETDRRPTPAIPMKAPRPMWNGGHASFSVVEARVDVWDAHIAGCDACLVQGEYLCYEGEFLTERVVEAREMARTLAQRAERVPFASLFGRVALPGVSA